MLAALQLDEHVLPFGQRLWRSASVRAAAGTFAGLMPLSSGLAAAGALPAPAQQLASNVLSPIGVTVPAPEHQGERGRGAGGRIPGPRETTKSKGDAGRDERPAEQDHGRPKDEDASPGASDSTPGQGGTQPKNGKPHLAPGNAHPHGRAHPEREHPEHPHGAPPGNPDPGPPPQPERGGAHPRGRAHPEPEHPEHPHGAPPGNPDPGPPPQPERGGSRGGSK
jgi:hypothetical protein